MNVLGLVQLCTTAEGSAGYSHSFGIEQLVRGGRLRSPEELTVLVRRVLVGSIGPADGVASGIAFRAARGGAFERLPEVCSALSSERVPLPMRLASVQMGQRLWGLSRGWDWAAGMHQQLDPLAERTDLHHAVAFGALVSETTSSQARAIATYLFNTAKGIILSAVRTIPLDEMVGQRVLAEVQPTITELAAACVDKEPDAIRAAGEKGQGNDPLGSLFAAN